MRIRTCLILYYLALAVLEFSVQIRLALNSQILPLPLCLPASASWVLGLKVCTTTQWSWGFYRYYFSSITLKYNNKLHIKMYNLILASGCQTIFIITIVNTLAPLQAFLGLCNSTCFLKKSCLQQQLICPFYYFSFVSRIVIYNFIKSI